MSFQPPQGPSGCSSSTMKGLCHPGALGDSLLSLLVELLAELQWRNAMLLPVLVVGLQDLTVKLLGSCSDFKMENISVQREHPPKVRWQASEWCPDQTSGHMDKLPFSPPAKWATVMPCSTPLLILSPSLISPSTPLHICTP